MNGDYLETNGDSTLLTWLKLRGHGEADLDSIFKQLEGAKMNDDGDLVLEFRTFRLIAQWTAPWS